MTPNILEARALKLTRSYARSTPKTALAEADPKGRSASRWRHLVTDDPSGPITQFYALCMDPNIDGAALVTGAHEALVARYQDADPKVLRARLDHLIRDREHQLQAQQDRALMAGEGVNDAIRQHAACLLEIAALRVLLGIETEDDR